MKTQSLRRYAAFLVALLVLSSVPGCDGESPTAPTLPDGDVFPLELYFAINSGLVEQERRIVRETTAYSQLQEDIFGDDPNAVPLFDVDFTQNMVLAVASGEQPEGCHSIDITAASADGTDLTVTVTETGPPSTGCACSQELVQPVQVVQVPRADEVIFVNRTATSCPS